MSTPHRLEEIVLSQTERAACSKEVGDVLHLLEWHSGRLDARDGSGLDGINQLAQCLRTYGEIIYAPSQWPTSPVRS
jgi:hypothetical protein